MKKFFSILFVAAALTIVSCGGNANKPADQTETTEIEVIVEDSTACPGACSDTTCCAEGEPCKGTADACKAEETAPAAEQNAE